MKIKLAYTPDWAMPAQMTSESKKGEKPVYHPHLSIEGAAAKKLKHLEVGEEIEMTITVKVESVSMNEHSGENGKTTENCSVGFKVLTLDCPEAKGHKDKDGASAMDEYRKGYKKH